jgi:UDPglucose 6-dehydrogenase
MIGTGYVGLVSGACFSQFGHEVVCVDNDQDKITALQAGEIPIFEPGLAELVEMNVRVGRLSFTTDLAAAVASSDAVFIAVGTPARRGDGDADLTFVYAAAEDIGKALDGYTVVVTKSTVPVGTGREVESRIRAVRPDAEFDVASNPEFLREGAAIDDFMRPDRVVCGTEVERAQKVISDVYRPLYLNETPVLFTSIETSELIKYAANCFLATKITFINEMADLCERVGADVQAVARGMGLDGRIGSKFLHAGPGYGGSCFPKDTQALATTARKHGAPMQIVESVIEVNAERKRQMANKVAEGVGGSVAGRTIAVLGLTFKPNTDDMRDAPSLDIIPLLQEAGATVRAYDPEGMDEAKRILKNVEWCDEPYAAMDGADALVIVTEWNEFRALDLSRVKSLLKSPVMVDLRNIYIPSQMAEVGFHYSSIGRLSVAPVNAQGGLRAVT